MAINWENYEKRKSSQYDPLDIIHEVEEPPQYPDYRQEYADRIQQDIDRDTDEVGYLRKELDDIDDEMWQAERRLDYFTKDRLRIQAIGLSWRIQDLKSRIFNDQLRKRC